MSSKTRAQESSFTPIRPSRFIPDRNAILLPQKQMPVSEKTKESVHTGLPLLKFITRNIAATGDMIASRSKSKDYINVGKFAMPSQAEMANYVFWQQVRQIPGVVNVINVQGCSRGVSVNPSIRVIVPDLLGTTAWEVIRLQEQIYRKFPNVRFNVELEDLLTYNPDEEIVEIGHS